MILLDWLIPRKPVSGVVHAGPAEQSMEEEWQKLQEHPDILAAAPDDEVLAEMLALQVSALRGLRLVSGSPATTYSRI